MNLEVKNTKLNYGELWETPYGSCLFGNKKLDPKIIQDHCQNRKFIKMKQVHGNKIVSANNIEQETSEPPVCDGLVTDNNNVALAVQTADCLPIAIMNKDRVFAIHAGWRGLSSGIIFSVAFLMKLEADSIAIVGPHIQVQSFEVGWEVITEMKNSLLNRNIPFDESQMVFKHPDPNKCYMNLKYVCQLQLNSLGVNSSQQFYSNVDTFSDIEWSSYRRDKNAAGRNWLLVLKK